MPMILILHALATLLMTGIIWFVAVVHYPLLLKIGQEHFIEYMADHQRLTGFVVIPPMLAELITAVMLVLYPPDSVPLFLLWIGLILVIIIWISTFAIQVPLHRKLANGFDHISTRSLVATNWIRVILWSLRSVVIASLFLF